MSIGWWIACLTIGALGLVSTLVLIWALCVVSDDADRQADELLCRELQQDCTVGRRQPAGGVEQVTDRVRHRYRGACR